MTCIFLNQVLCAKHHLKFGTLIYEWLPLCHVRRLDCVTYKGTLVIWQVVHAAAMLPLRVLKCVLSNLHVSKCLCVLLCADRNILEALSPADRPAEGSTQLHGAAAEERPSFALQVYLLTRPSQATMTAHDY